MDNIQLEQTDGSATRVDSNSVAYLLGIMPRSGTNFLSDLICLHPECGITVRITEDFLYANANHLEKYVSAVHQSWDELWGTFEEDLKTPLYHALGNALEQYLYAQTNVEWLNKYCTEKEPSPTVKILPRLRIARTPSVENLHLIPKFTDAKVIIIVRDGRSVVESGIRSFGWLFEDAVQRWARSANLIEAALQKHPQMLCVRYEDLVTDQERELRRIFSFLGVDTESYDYRIDAPVRGSSTFFDKDKGMNWQATTAKDGFDPLRRWKEWNSTMHQRFNWVAGKQLQMFGYKPVRQGNSLWSLYNFTLDAAWPLRNRLRGVARSIIPKHRREQILWSRRNRYRQAVLRA